MKCVLAVALLAGIVAAEVPSHSYLPPPPRGYPQASSPPSVIAARTLDVQNPDHHNGDHHGTADVRNSPQNHDYSTENPQVRYNDEQGYDQNAPGYTRNGLDDANTTVNYDSDERGFKPQSYEDTEDLTRSSGYNENANNFRSSNGYNQNGGQNNGYHGNDQDGERYQGNRNGRSSRTN